MMFHPFWGGSLTRRGRSFSCFVSRCVFIEGKVLRVMSGVFAHILRDDDVEIW